MENRIENSNVKMRPGRKQGIIIHPEELTERMIGMITGTSINVLGLHPVGGEHADQSLDALLEYLVSRTALLASRLRSDTGKYFFWSDDVLQATCNCEKCRELSASDQAMVIYNTMLTGIRRVDPQARQCFLAYHATMEPPRQIRPAEGIFVEYAPIHRDTGRPVKEQKCGEGQNHGDGQTYEQIVGELLACFGTKDSRVLEYWMDNSLFSGWKKPPKYLEICEETIRTDLAFYRSCGFEDITSFGCYLSDDYIELYGTPPIREYAECF